MTITSLPGFNVNGRTSSVPFNQYKGPKSRKANIGAQTSTVVSSASNPAPGSVVTVSATNGYKLKANLVADHVLQRAEFTMGQNRFIDTGGLLKKDVSINTGVGTTVGTVLSSLGEIILESDFANLNNSVTNFRAVQAPPSSGVKAPFLSADVFFRTAASPIRSGSLSVIGSMEDGEVFNVTAGIDGKINGARVKGRVNYETGLVELFFVNPALVNAPYLINLTELGIPGVTTLPVSLARTSTIRYNAVSYTYLPLDAEILGLDPVRLPQDGRIPVFKTGRVVVIHNTQQLAPQTVVNNQTVACGRTNLARVKIVGFDKQEIKTGFSVNLDTGNVLFTNVAGMSQPITVEHRIEDEALIADSQITGDLRLTRAVTHDYPVSDTYVSSAMVVKTLQAAAEDSFAQLAWTSVWSNTAIGEPILAAYNQASNPIQVTNAGAITMRWALIFTSTTAFRVIGEGIGQIMTGDITSNLSPVNPAAGVPYFTLLAAGWGSGWSAGNVLRFNTRGANFPLWVARTVLQSPAAAPGTDKFTLELRGDIDA